MKKVLFSFLLLGFLASCSSDDVDPVKPDPVKPDPKKKALNISSAMLDEKYKGNIVSAKSIGVALFDDSEITPIMEYTNLDGVLSPRFSNTRQTSSNPWRPRTSKDSLFLYDNKVAYKLFAFSPYDKEFSIKEVKKITPKDYTEKSDLSFVYMDKLSYDKPDVGLSLKHLYSRITLSVGRVEYKVDEDVVISKIAIYGQGIMKTANVKFDNFAKSEPEFSRKESSKVGDISIDLDPVVTLDKLVTHEIKGFLLIPASAEEFGSAPTTLVITVNGQDVECKIPVSGSPALTELIGGQNYLIRLDVQKADVSSNATLKISKIDKWEWSKPLDS